MKKELEEALTIVMEHLTDINAHTVAGMLDWTLNGNPDSLKDEKFYRAWLAAKGIIYGLDGESVNE